MSSMNSKCLPYFILSLLCNSGKPTFRRSRHLPMPSRRYWGGVSDEAKDLIAQMLTVDPKQRPSAEALLAHPWLQTSGELLRGKALDKTRGEIKKWAARRRFKAAAGAVVAVQRISLMTGHHHKA